MMEVRQWWQRIMANWRRSSPSKEAVQLEEVEQELQVTAIEERTAQTLASVARVHPDVGREQVQQAEMEAREIAARRRTLERERDVLRRHVTPGQGH